MTSAATAVADGTLAIEPPLRVLRAEDVRWADSCDVLVAGFGAAGAATAISAHQAGRSVLVLDRFAGGGASAKSGGVVYAGGGTRHQIQAGYQDTPENMARYLATEVGTAVSPATLKRFCDDSVGLLEWLESMGAQFHSNVPPPKTSYPKDGCYLYYSGNEGLLDAAAIATPAPRGHRMRDKGLSGKALFAVLSNYVTQLGIRVKTQHAVVQLICAEGDGQVLGAVVRTLSGAAAEQHQRWIQRAEAVHNVFPAWADRLRAKAAALELRSGQLLNIRAHKGLVLATGGFIFNREMVTRFAPKYLKNMRLGTTGCDGSGIRLGVSHGAVMRRVDKISAWRFINPPLPWARSMVIGPQGERFCNESAYGARLGVAMCENHGGKAWLILNADLRRAAIKEALLGGLWAFQSIPALLLMWTAPKAASLAALAEKIGVPAQKLAATAAAYTECALKQTPDSFHKAPALLQSMDTGPFWALDISNDNPRFPCPAITLGGLSVDEATGAVVDSHDHAIPGLFAVGRAAVGLASNQYLSGLSLADCLWSGRRTGQFLGQDSVA